MELYVQRTIQCRKCYRFGHVANHCKGKERCSSCGGPHSSSSCQDTIPSCLHCKGNHKADDIQKCPEFLVQRNIKSLMATENISYSEAKSQISTGASYAKIASPNLNLNDSQVFPALPVQQDSSNNSFSQTHSNFKNNNKGETSQSSKPASTIVSKPSQNISNTINIPQNPIIESSNYIANINFLKEVIIDSLYKILAANCPSISKEISSPQIQTYIINIIEQSISNIMSNVKNSSY